MTAIAQFDPARFAARYPEFDATPEAMLRSCFAESGLYLDNTGSSRVPDLDRRAMLLDMITAHIAFLSSADARAVGPLASASEGAVSVSFQGTPGTAAWFCQSKYGAAFWQATAYLRSFRYSAGVTTV